MPLENIIQLGMQAGGAFSDAVEKTVELGIQATQVQEIITARKQQMEDALDSKLFAVMEKATHKNTIPQARKPLFMQYNAIAAQHGRPQIPEENIELMSKMPEVSQPLQTALSNYRVAASQDAKEAALAKSKVLDLIAKQYGGDLDQMPLVKEDILASDKMLQASAQSGHRLENTAFQKEQDLKRQQQKLSTDELNKLITNTSAYSKVSPTAQAILKRQDLNQLLEAGDPGAIEARNELRKAASSSKGELEQAKLGSMAAMIEWRKQRLDLAKKGYELQKDRLGLQQTRLMNTQANQISGDSVAKTLETAAFGGQRAQELLSSPTFTTQNASEVVVEINRLLSGSSVLPEGREKSQYIGSLKEYAGKIRAFIAGEPNSAIPDNIRAQYADTINRITAKVQEQHSNRILRLASTKVGLGKFGLSEEAATQVANDMRLAGTPELDVHSYIESRKKAPKQTSENKSYTYTVGGKSYTADKATLKKMFAQDLKNAKTDMEKAMMRRTYKNITGEEYAP